MHASHGIVPGGAVNEATGLETTLQNLMVLDYALRLATCRWCWSRNGVAAAEDPVYSYHFRYHLEHKL
jgi:hypothetical protein